MGKRGFSLIEMIMVLSIMTVIAGLALPVMFTQVNRAKITREKGELAAIRTAVENHFSDTFAFPKKLESLLENKEKRAGWAGPYYNPGIPMFGSGGGTGSLEDQWSRKYKIGEKGVSVFVVESAGPDGVFSSKDDLSVTVDTTFIRRRVTLAELDAINSAVLSYNKLHIKSDPLPPQWNSLFLKLVAAGFLPAGDSSYKYDGWEKSYLPDPPGVTPVVRVISGMGK
jgi:prepilin-type N-terminal cleavage/methylation domain-containing protein